MALKCNSNNATQIIAIKLQCINSHAVGRHHHQHHNRFNTVVFIHSAIFWQSNVFIWADQHTGFFGFGEDPDFCYRKKKNEILNRYITRELFPSASLNGLKFWWNFIGWNPVTTKFLHNHNIVMFCFDKDCNMLFSRHKFNIHFVCSFIST